MDEMIAEFIVDCSENLEEFETNLLDLEKNPESFQVVDSMFRQIHSIKGASGFLSFKNLESLTHKSESVLDLIRQAKGQINQPLISTFLDVCDAMKSMFSTIKSNGNDGDNQYPSLLERLKEFENLFKNPDPSVLEAKGEEEKLELDSVQIEALKSLGFYQEEQAKEAEVREQEDSEETLELDPVQIESLKALGLYDPSKLKVKQEEALPQKEKNEIKQEVVTAANLNKEKNIPTKIKETIRVDVEVLDHLMNLAGELVLIRNQILELAKTQKTSVFANSFNNLDMITGEIQRSLMTTRMQPISVVWSKIPRIVRDLAAQLNKEIEIQMQGENTELDKTIIEAITDPMTHIIRNCCDHGIEEGEERLAKGKKFKGLIKLSAEHRGNWIYVDVIDDGKGISRSVLKKKALEKNLYSQEELDQMDDQAILNIIFHPGFSTKDQASNISGRGVGMDVIRSNINKINGTVELSSIEGQATHLKIKLPLTLAIIPAVIVLIEGDRYAIPQSAVQEVASVKATDLENFDNIAGQKFTRLRGNILPLIDAKEVLNINHSEARDNLSYVVINADGFRYGLIIEKVTDIIEIVVKPLDADQDFKYYAGATIMGDGKVALILEPSKIAEIANIDKLNLDDVEREKFNPIETDKLTLSFKLNNGKNYLIPLSKTSRIEEINKADLDYREIGIFAKFNGRVIRMIDLMNLLGLGDSDFNNQEACIKALYYEFNGHGIAVNVGQEQNLLKEGFEIEACEGSEFVIGTTLIKDQIFEVLNIEDYLGTILGANSSQKEEKQEPELVIYEDLFDTENSVISFKFGDLLFGLKLNSVSEILNETEFTPIPGSRSTLQGLINLRGEIMVKKKFTDILSINPEIDLNIRKNLIVKYEDKKICLEIQEVREILNLSGFEYGMAPKNIPEHILKYLKGVYNLGQHMLLLIDEKKLTNEIEVTT